MIVTRMMSVPLLIGTLAGSVALAQSPTPTQSLIQAIHACDGDRIKALLDAGADANAIDPGFITSSPVLNVAASGDCVVAVKLLMEHGAKVQSTPGGVLGSSPPLVDAAEKGYAGVVKELLDHGADINALGGFAGGKTPLIAAFLAGHNDLVQLLLRRGARVDTRETIAERTPLIESAIDANLRLANFLVDHNADVNARDRTGATALMWAAQSGSLEITRLLLAHGADPNVKSGKLDTSNVHWPAGATALAIAKQAGHPDIVEALQKRP